MGSCYNLKSRVRAVSHSAEHLPNTSEVHLPDPTTTKRSHVVPHGCKPFKITRVGRTHASAFVLGCVFQLPGLGDVLTVHRTISSPQLLEASWRPRSAGLTRSQHEGPRFAGKTWRGEPPRVCLHLDLTASHTPCDLPDRRLSMNGSGSRMVCCPASWGRILFLILWLLYSISKTSTHNNLYSRLPVADSEADSCTGSLEA